MFNSVRSRLTVWYAAVLTCSLLLLSLVIYFIVKESVFARMDAGESVGIVLEGAGKQ